MIWWAIVPDYREPQFKLHVDSDHVQVRQRGDESTQQQGDIDCIKKSLPERNDDQATRTINSSCTHFGP